MENRKAYKALLQVAENNGLSLDEVIGEIESAIKDAIETAKRENNQEALSMWAQIPSKGEYPTAVEVIAAMGDKIG